MTMLAAAMIAAFCVPAVAIAEPEQSFEGRWISERPKLTLDVARCGDGWCGVEATAEGACGPTVLRTETSTPNENGALVGRLKRADEALPYAVAMRIYRRPDNGTVSLVIVGNSGTRFEPWRRSFLFRAEMARIGDPACRHDPKLS
jgi:hypothetical protein